MLKTSADPVIDSLSVHGIDTALVMKIIEPLRVEEAGNGLAAASGGKRDRPLGNKDHVDSRLNAPLARLAAHSST
ncbi:MULTISPECIES: hypothetical protein [unclassified Bradyrhizobium]|uniref:hypothetical protein n=1 Tax=unclassified Bradyrhizobium TaxID=2631580 RepID=UPI0028E802FA|nr:MULTISPECIES: hypothetical protein [unclassified Bradyrhizobium]